MKVAVYPHTLEIGGSQLNAVELAWGVRELGADVVVFGQPGPLEERIDQLGLEFVRAPLPRRRPSPAVIRALCDLVSERGIDVVHGYEWTTLMEAYWGPRARLGTPVVGTVMSMSVAPFLPHDLPLAVGTEQIAALERTLGRPVITVIEPPVDVESNAQGTVDQGAFRSSHGLQAGDFVIVCVTRFSAELKLEGVLSAVSAAGRLADDPTIRLVLVGDGPARDQVQAAAAAVNAQAGRQVVILTGELRDPRPAYAAADVCLGMGGSALRGMSFATPLIVQGEGGFWELLTPETVGMFLWTGWYGVGVDAAAGPGRLERLVRDLRDDPARRTELGQFGRQLAHDRFSLRSAAARQLAMYQNAVASPLARGPRWWETAGISGARFARHEVTRRLARIAGRAASDDFNARPVAAMALPPGTNASPVSTPAP